MTAAGGKGGSGPGAGDAGGGAGAGRRLLEGRAVIVTGAGRGLGRAHALELARQGALVTVNDLSVALDGSPEGGGPGARAASPAEAVTAEIVSAGGAAVASEDDVADFEGAGRIVEASLRAFGRLDAVVNNAGFVRDRMFVNTAEEEWDAVVRVHLKGHFCVSRHAAAHWRSLSKETGAAVSGRIVNTSSGAGLLGSVGQAAYSAAKAGIVGLTLVQAAELARYGVTANAIAPSARTRMTENVFAGTMAAPDDPAAFDPMAPENVSPLVAYLCSVESAGVTGRVLEIEGGRLTVMDGWQRAATFEVARRYRADEVGEALAGLLARSPGPLPAYGAP